MEARFLLHGLGLLLLLATQHAPAVAIPGPECQTKCGGVDIPYPFGIGDNCSLSAGFNASCQEVQRGVYKPFLGDAELLNISLINGTLRGMNHISTNCYNSDLMEAHPWTYDASRSPYRFSDTQNKFTVIGCNALAYIYDTNGTGYKSGCVSTCQNLRDLTNGTCSGVGCCQTAIPKGLGYYDVVFDSGFNASQDWNFSRCSYAVLMEAESFNFSTTYINTTMFNDTNTGQVPLVMDWAIRNGTMSLACEEAKLNKTGTYACLSSNSGCVNSRNGPGYLCNCSEGYEGNPYLPDGCHDVDECKNSPCPSGGVTLSSAAGILFLAAVVAVLTRRWQRIVQKRLRKIYFRKNKGILLEQLISSDHNASDGTKIFSLNELEKATDNFDHTRVVGRGGHGTVYKGILTDQRVVAIKRSKVKESIEIEQFINEVAILSQINHRNVVKLHGCCLETEVPLLVYEFISNGTLYDLLHCEKNGILLPLSWEERLRIAVEVAGALAYLHSAASMAILHRDIKCMNILLNDSYTAKVSDFGASKSIPFDQTHLVTAVQGTFGYLDPEYYHTGHLNEKSDVYSFGVILLELLTRKKAIIVNGNGERQNLSSFFFEEMGMRPLDEVVDREILEKGSEEVIMSMARLAEECLSLTREERPTMKDVEMRLQMLRARQGVTPRKRMDGEVARRCEAVRANMTNGAILVAAASHHGSRQYSLEQEFVLSSQVPR
ncbi:wall-associated receptor kinase 5-like isoform X2 [Panicum miliaceum]|uniref:Wall-associated receptor kinase 5-like isoform X2 n=1 Tax=Panicum miliaceum TaxID=4540 RepID=A0A3L6QB87_PANMI|nr:wall-associated receptor kinase 5-like isoform X2 [Panicum miliaceum]